LSQVTAFTLLLDSGNQYIFVAFKNKSHKKREGRVGPPLQRV